jgi:hypothetical protein
MERSAHTVHLKDIILGNIDENDDVVIIYYLYGTRKVNSPILLNCV